MTRCSYSNNAGRVLLRVDRYITELFCRGFCRLSEGEISIYTYSYFGFRMLMLLDRDSQYLGTLALLWGREITAPSNINDWIFKKKKKKKVL